MKHKIKILASIDIYNHASDKTLVKAHKIHIMSRAKNLLTYKNEIEHSYLTMLQMFENAGQFNGRPFALPEEIVFGKTGHFTGQMFALILDNQCLGSYDHIELYDGSDRFDDEHYKVDKLINNIP